MDAGTKQAGTAITGLFVMMIICACCIYCLIEVANNMKDDASPAPAPAPAPGSGPLCANVSTATFPSPASAQASLTITAPAGATISSIEYANFGNSTGVCGAFTNGACVLYPDATVKSLVSAACVGKSTCSVAVDPSTFGTLTPPSDAACLTNAKLNVQYRTTGGSPAPAPSPSPAPAPSPSPSA